MKGCLIYTSAFFALMIAILTGVIIRLSQIPNDIDIRLDDKTASTFQPRLLDEEEIRSYEKEGVVFVKRLISTDQAVKLRDSGETAMSRVFSIAKLFGSSRYSNLAFDLWRTSPDVASLVLQALPKVVSQILPYSKNENDEVEFRLLRDAFFQYSGGGLGCGWHVDDAGFWPTEEDYDGPTVWIALDGMTVAEGGGLAVLNRTKFQELSDTSGNVTEGSCRQSIQGRTCEMDTVRPECHALMEASKLEWDVSPGDAIIWNRWTFHRGVAALSDETDMVKRRYSVRYMPYGSKAFGNVHHSIERGQPFNSPYYPQVWPNLIKSESAELQHGLEADAKLSRVLLFALKMAQQKVTSMFDKK